MNTLTHNNVELDKQGKLLQKFYAYDGFTAPVIAAYDNWIANDLPLKIARTQLRCADGILTFANITTDLPRMGIEEARERNLSYGSDIYADVLFQAYPAQGQPPQTPVTLGRIPLGKIPVIIGAKLSQVHGKTEEQLLEMGEDPHDPNGYVINKGTEKLVLIQEKLRMNRIFVFVGDKKGGKKSTAKGALVARMTCSSPTGSTLVLLKEGKIRDVDLSLHFMGKNNEGEQNSINVITAFRMLGAYIDHLKNIVNAEDSFANVKTIIDTVMRFSNPDPRWQRKVWIAIQPSILRAAQQSAREDDFSALAKKMFASDNPNRDLPPDAKRDRIIKGFLDELFPQIEADNPVKKYEMLAMMMARFLEVLSGLRKADDRDNWGNKRLETAAIAMERLFNCAFDQSMKATQKSLDDKQLTKETALKAFTHQNIITDNFTSSFNSNNWGCKGSYYKENITDILKRDNIIASYSHVRRVNTPTSRKAKQPTIRLVPMSSLGYICPIETPEGENLGIVKNLATGCYISIARDEVPIRQAIEPYISSEYKDAIKENRNTKCLLNGRLLGWCNGPELTAFAVSRRRQGAFPRDTCITYNDGDDILYIYCDGSRPVRPLLIVDDGKTVLTKKDGTRVQGVAGKLVIDELDMWDAPFPDLLSSGCVEYIDAFEQEYIKLAATLDMLNSIEGSIAYTERNLAEVRDNLARARAGEVVMKRVIIGNEDKTSPQPYTIEELEEHEMQLVEVLKGLRKKRPYTHCELDPQSIISVAASTIPKLEHNQSPRNVYQCTMAKQALGIPGSNYQNRFDTTTKMLAAPSKPLFAPQIDAEIGLGDLPVGQNTIIAIKTHKGFNQEDSFVANEAAIQRGLFRMIKYIVKKTTLKQTGGIKEFFEIPKINAHDGDRYANLLEDGTPRVGAVLRQNDAVIGKSVQIIGDNTKQNASIFVGLSEEGIVDRVLKTTTEEGWLTIKVRIRQVRKPEIGDKFAPRHAQKGTTGKNEDANEMPFIESGPNEGLTPSLIINPHSIPSRMTISMLIELVQSKICAMTGKRFNATAFRNVSIDQIMATLRQYGFNQYSNEVLVSGQTGKRIKTEIFMGPVYYQALRHHVKDKIQMRSRGAVNPTTHQPVGGRIRRGGLRFGEMERDSLISHGASALLRERLNDVSDAYRAVFCKTCGTIAITDVDNKIYRCRFCGPRAEFGIVVIPYAAKLLLHLLWGANFNLRLILS